MQVGCTGERDVVAGGVGGRADPLGRGAGLGATVSADAADVMRAERSLDNV
jgi:hypothetical protein